MTLFGNRGAMLSALAVTLCLSACNSVTDQNAPNQAEEMRALLYKVQTRRSVVDIV